jgi:hypothetical protein
MPSCGVINRASWLYASATARPPHPIDTVGLALAVKPERGHHRDNVVIEQLLEHLNVHTLDLAREQVVHAVQGCRLGGQ